MSGEISPATVNLKIQLAQRDLELHALRCLLNFAFELAEMGGIIRRNQHQKQNLAPKIKGCGRAKAKFDAHS